MEVALFPLAALLLLLSGVSVRRCAEVPSEDHTLQLLQRVGSHRIKIQSHEVLYRGTCKVNRAVLQVRFGNQFHQKLGSTSDGTPRSAGVLARRVVLPERLAMRRYRTRFGLICGAYQAIGPPVYPIWVG